MQSTAITTTWRANATTAASRDVTARLVRRTRGVESGCGGIT